MASSSKYKGPYDVFLSFRGEVRNNFVGHLYDALVRNGIHTFRDSEELEKGDDISMLLEAIEGSRIAIIVFSENYASSTWCLKEVAKIMECKKQKGLAVRPVFYKVDPREVRTGRQSYAKALTEHESKFKKEIVEGWKKALFDAGSLSGWTLNDRDDESVLIREIVEDISTRLDRKPFDVAVHPVGIEYQVVVLKSMLKLESKDDVLMVGLWGQGGIGKSTLAKAIYNDIFRQFEGSSFLARVRENSKDCKGLQGQLLNDILKPHKKIEVSNVEEGTKLIQDRLDKKSVLVILDDVDDWKQLCELARNAKWFGNGSRILVTTRDQHVLAPGNGWDHVSKWEVKALAEVEARKLFSKHAFPAYQKLESKTNLVDGFLNRVECLPLALVVLGSFLRDKTESEWESTLERLPRFPDKTINDVLKISFDGLEKDYKEIFLHIACFFKGWGVERVKKVLASCDFNAEIGLRILIQRSLLRIESGNIQMHDLIQLMGKDIVNQESKDPGKRSRLWLQEDVLNILSPNLGDCSAEAIVLKLPEPTELCIGPDAFTKMRMLRLLILNNVRSSFQGHIYLPRELRWLEWDGSWIPEFSPGQKNLVGLTMSNCSSPMEPHHFRDFGQLKYIHLRKCHSLVSTHDISLTPKVEELEIYDCRNLEIVHESIARHDKLQLLTFFYCFELRAFPNVLESENLKSLEIVGGTEFKRFPDIPHRLEGLKELDLEYIAIEELPASIENFVSLEKMKIKSCDNLISLPSSIYKLQNLKDLGIKDCESFIGLPKYEPAGPQMENGLPNLQRLCLRRCNLSEVEFLENLSCFPFLTKLDLSRTNITGLPPSIGKRDHLSQLIINHCRQLQEIPELPPSLKYLDATECGSLQTNGHLTSIDRWVRQASTMVHTASLAQKDCLSFRLPGGEMPEWFQPVEEDSISFKASKDLYNKFLGLVFCVLLKNKEEEEEEEHSFEIVAHFNGQRRGNIEEDLYLSGLNLILLQYCTPFDLWKAVDFGQIDGSYGQFSLTQSSGDVKKWGFQIMCKPLEDDLKAEIRDNELIDLAFLYEVGHDSTDPEAESSLMHEVSSIETDLHEGLQDSQMSAEAREPRPRGLLIRLGGMSMACLLAAFVVRMMKTR